MIRSIAETLAFFMALLSLFGLVWLLSVAME